MREHRQILVLHDTVKGVACETLKSEPMLHGIPGCRTDTKSKKNVFTCTSGRQKCHLTMLVLCCTDNGMIVSFLYERIDWSTKISFCRKRGVYELVYRVYKL